MFCTISNIFESFFAREALEKVSKALVIVNKNELNSIASLARKDKKTKVSTRFFSTVENFIGISFNVILITT